MPYSRYEGSADQLTIVTDNYYLKNGLLSEDATISKKIMSTDEVLQLDKIESDIFVLDCRGFFELCAVESIFRNIIVKCKLAILWFNEKVDKKVQVKGNLYYICGKVLSVTDLKKILKNHMYRRVINLNKVIMRMKSYEDIYITDQELEDYYEIKHQESYYRKRFFSLLGFDDKNLLFARKMSSIIYNISD